VTNVLVACCIPIDNALAQINLGPSQKQLVKGKELESYKEKIRKTLLTQGYYQAMIPFPCLLGRIPTMAADLKKLDFIALSEIGNSDKPFLRIASIDSPFRELVSWAYQHTACRPGLPDRDFNSWVEEIIACL
jgi:CTP synthase